MDIYFKKKNLIIYSVIFLAIFFILRDMRELIEFFKFDINASDLTGDGVSLRNAYFSSYYDPAILYSDLINYIVIILPLLYAISIFNYNRIKSKSLKYLIGKSRNFNKLLFNLKLKLATISVIVIYSILLCYTLVSYIITGFKIRQGANFDSWFLDSNIFYFVNGSFIKFIILYFLVIGLYIFFMNLILLLITDYGYSYIYVIIGYILLVYVVDDFISMYISREVRVQGSLTFLLGGDDNITTVISYVYMAIIYSFLKFKKRKEF